MFCTLSGLRPALQFLTWEQNFLPESLVNVWATLWLQQVVMVRLLRTCILCPRLWFSIWKSDARLLHDELLLKMIVASDVVDNGFSTWQDRGGSAILPRLLRFYGLGTADTWVVHLHPNGSLLAEHSWNNVGVSHVSSWSHVLMHGRCYCHMGVSHYGQAVERLSISLLFAWQSRTVIHMWFDFIFATVLWQICGRKKHGTLHNMPGYSQATDILVVAKKSLFVIHLCKEYANTLMVP